MSVVSISGIVHITFSLLALGAGARSFLRHGGITGATAAGCVYLMLTSLSCLTGLFIFTTGEITHAHVLGLVTLAVTGVAVSARAARPFGKASLAVENVSYSLTYLFLVVPAVTETVTRLPAGSPLVDDASAPVLKLLTIVMIMLFLVGSFWQLFRLNAAARS